MIDNVQIVITEEPRFSSLRLTTSILHQTVPKIFCESINWWFINILFFMVYEISNFWVLPKLNDFLENIYKFNRT